MVVNAAKYIVFKIKLHLKDLISEIYSICVSLLYYLFPETK